MNSIGSIPPIGASATISAATARPADMSGPSFQDCLRDSLRKLAENTPEASASQVHMSATNRTAQAQLAALGEQAIGSARVIEQVGNRVTATIDEIKQIRV